MAKVSLQTLGRQLAAKRDELGVGVRKIADEVGVSAATLSRVERGYMPDIETFKKICVWLDVDPGEILGVNVANKPEAHETIAVHFRKDREITPQTASALAQLILAAQRSMMASDKK